MLWRHALVFFYTQGDKTQNNLFVCIIYLLLVFDFYNVKQNTKPNFET